MHLKFLNLNLWSQPDHPPEGKLHAAALAFLKKENADIVALQEVYNGTDSSLPPLYRQYQIIQDALGLPFAHFAPAFLDQTNFGKVLHGNCVLSRYPITQSAITFFDEPFRERQMAENLNGEFTPRNLEYVCVDAAGTTINVFNTQGIWGVDGTDNPRRLLMSQTIVQSTAGKKNVIVSGDFNVDEKTDSIRSIEKGLHNIFKNERTSSFNLTHKNHPGFATAVVDFIFASPTINVISHTIPDDDVSDHRPLIATLEI